MPPRSGATASTDGASTWLFGGYAEADGERAVVNDLHRLDATATGWARVRESADGADVPGPRLATASAVLDGEMLLFGGDTGGFLSAELWAWRMSGGGLWSLQTPSGTPPSARSGHSSGVISPSGGNGVADSAAAERAYMVIYGGRGPNGRCMRDIFLLCLESRT